MKLLLTDLGVCEIRYIDVFSSGGGQTPASMCTFYREEIQALCKAQTLVEELRPLLGEPHSWLVMRACQGQAALSSQLRGAAENKPSGLCMPVRCPLLHTHRPAQRSGDRCRAWGGVQASAEINNAEDRCQARVALHRGHEESQSLLDHQCRPPGQLPAHNSWECFRGGDSIAPHGLGPVVPVTH